MKGAYFVTAIPDPQFKSPYVRYLPTEQHFYFDSAEARDRKASELREEGFLVRTSDGT